MALTHDVKLAGLSKTQIGNLAALRAEVRRSLALLPRLFGKDPRSHHKGATGRVRTGNQRLPVLCHHCQLGQDIPDRGHVGLPASYPQVA